MLEWSSIVLILTQLKYSRASNLDAVYHAALNRERDAKSNHAVQSRQKDSQNSTVAQCAHFEHVTASTYLKTNQMGRDELKKMSFPQISEKKLRARNLLLLAMNKLPDTHFFEEFWGKVQDHMVFTVLQLRDLQKHQCF